MTTKKVITKKAKRRFLLLGTLSIFITIFIIFTISSYWIQIYRKTIEHKFLKVQMQTLLEEELRLKTEIQKLQDPEYVARYARENIYFQKMAKY